MFRNKLMIVLAVLTISACKDPTIPDPTIQLSPPPAELMAPPDHMKPIPKKTNG